jgi:hypothetical protein
MKRVRTFCAAVAAVAAVAVAGCADRPRGPAVVTIDTLASGVVRVRNASGATLDDDGWRLEEVVRIGAAEGAEPSTFGRVSDVAIGPHEQLYILDGQADELRVFDFAGRHIRSFGRAGAGPGELQGPFAIAFDPDGKLWVAQESGRRYSVFDSVGQPVATHRRPFRWPVTTGVLQFSRDGLLHEYGWWSSGPGADIRVSIAPEVAIRDSVPLPPFRMAGWPMPGRETFLAAIPFAPTEVAGVGPEGEVWTGSGSSYRFARLDAHGDTLRIVELDVPPTPLSDEDVIVARAEADSAEASGFEVDRGLIPRHHPYFTAMTVADDGSIWMRRPTPPAAADPGARTDATFDVFTSSGEYRASVPAPVADFPGPSIVGDYLVGIARDALDVDYVVLYRIVAPRR